MNSLLLISPEQALGFKPILSGKITRIPIGAGSPISVISATDPDLPAPVPYFSGKTGFNMEVISCRLMIERLTRAIVPNGS
ncbi:hypothetical protein QUA35_20895 [Microcoleus sp. N9_B2]|uniref:hypothetical protein n=1 Tax=unclassified Microcoleus TaxID=2642155 RepID=UPI002FD07C42